MRKTALVLTGLLLLFPCTATGGPAKYRLKIAFQAPERSLWGQSLRAIAQEIEERTGGEVKLKLYASGVQGDDRTMQRKMRIGQLHGAVFLGSGLSDVCPDSLALNLPLLFESEKEVDSVLTAISPALNEQSRKKGYEIVSWARLGFSYLFSREKIRGIESLHGSKPWLIENDPVGRGMYEALGVTPVPTGVANVLPALQSGLVRTVFSPPVALIAMQWHTRIKYRLDLRITYSFACLAISKKAWDRLPREHQQTIRERFDHHTTKLNARSREQNEEALKVLQENGIETLKPETSSREDFARASDAVGEKLAGKKFSRDVLLKVRSLLKEYRRSAREQ